MIMQNFWGVKEVYYGIVQVVNRVSLPNRSQELSVLLSVFSKSVRTTSDLFDVTNHGSNDNAG